MIKGRVRIDGRGVELSGAMFHVVLDSRSQSGIRITAGMQLRSLLMMDASEEVCEQR